MLKNFGLHILKCPSGRWTYVGSIPVILTYETPADTSAVMGGRAYRSADGVLMTRKVPVFSTLEALEAHQRTHGIPFCTCCHN
jgi:hypothetical protein